MSTVTLNKPKTRVYNFNAGPAALPTEVLEQARDELVNWKGFGTSVMEISHRSKPFIEVAAEADKDLRELLNIPANYQILFLQGGARLQFAMVPMNLMQNKKKADYVNTGVWAKLAIAEAKRYGQVNIAASSESNNFTRFPAPETWQRDPEAAYLHFTANETVNGIELFTDPDIGTTPLVSDMSSNILSRPLDVTKYGLIYAGAQKNIGPAGITVVIIREDLLGHTFPFTPTMLDYKIHIDHESMYNTPPTFAWYLAGLVFKWLKRQGGVAAIAKINQRKAEKLYRFIDQSDFYHNPVDPASRSRMNVIFNLPKKEMEESFLKAANAAGLVGLKGHKLLGGMRASIYNAVPEAAVDALIEFMTDFQRKQK